MPSSEHVTTFGTACTRMVWDGEHTHLQHGSTTICIFPRSGVQSKNAVAVCPRLAQTAGTRRSLTFNKPAMVSSKDVSEAAWLTTTAFSRGSAPGGVSPIAVSGGGRNTSSSPCADAVSGNLRANPQPHVSTAIFLPATLMYGTDRLGRKKGHLLCLKSTH